MALEGSYVVMPHSHHYWADDTLPHDEIDDLFEKLEPLQPPPMLIARILSSVNQLPKHPLPQQFQQQQIQPSLPGISNDIGSLDAPVVRKEDLLPS